MDFEDRYCRPPRRIPVNDLDALGNQALPPPEPKNAETASMGEADGGAIGGEEEKAVGIEEAVEQEQATAEPGEIEELRSRLSAIEDRWKRAAADLDNLRKRFERELERMRQVERETILRSWLNVVDDMERALCAQGASASPWYEGMEAIRERMLSILAQFGVKPFVPEGEIFDPHFHEAVATANLPDVTEGRIVEVVQPGYLIDDRVLRAAKVIAVKRRT